MPTLPAAVEMACYRIALEAVTNVVHHARARTCSIRLSLEPAARLTLSISDDGRGIPPDAHYGVGLRSMRERAEEIGGALTVETPPNGGTCVCLHAPLQDPSTL
jgi:signal transduction histidine kinase